MTKSQDRLTALIGERIQIARKGKGLTQEQLCRRLGFKDRQILSNIESGKRKVTADELMNLMNVLGKDMWFFTDRLRLIGEGAFCWRAPDATEKMLGEFEAKAGTWIATYRTMGEELKESPSPVVPQLSLFARSSYEEAAAAGEQLIKEWDLRERPAEKLPETVESKLNTLVLNVDAPIGISGAACHLPQFNTILVNRRDPDGRRAFDFAHELFHLMTWDTMPPDYLDSGTPKNPKARRREQLANYFAASILMPRALVENLWKEKGQTEIHDWLNASAEKLGVTAQALKTRISTMKLVSEAERLTIQDSRLTWNGREPSEQELPSLFSRVFVERLTKALEHGYVSVRRAAKLLDLTIDDLEDLIRAYGFEPPFDL